MLISAVVLRETHILAEEKMTRALRSVARQHVNPKIEFVNLLTDSSVNRTMVPGAQLRLAGASPLMTMTTTPPTQQPHQHGLPQ
ncbi:MAG: hypothetical protein AAB542_00500, partial [Patescibacteria group bacterium]